jgi:hypothetical protein
MSKVLNKAAVVMMLGLAATGAAQARGANFDRTPHPFAQTETQGTHFGYGASRTLWPWYVPSHGIQGESCGDAFQPICR